MRIRRHYLNWGVFLIALGAVPLAVRLGGLPGSDVAPLLSLWPLVIVGIGISIILSRTSLDPIGGVFAAVILGLLVGALFAGGWHGFGGACLGTSGTAEHSTRTGLLAQPARVELEISCGKVSVTTATGGEYAVTSDFGPGVQLQSDIDQLTLRSTTSFLGGQADHDIAIRLPTSLDMVYVTLNAASGEFDFADTTMALFGGSFNGSDVRLNLATTDMSHGPLNMTLNGSSALVSLPSSGTGATGSISVNASSLELCVPPTLGLSIVTHEALSSNNFAQAGLTLDGQRWHTGGNADVNLNLNSNVSSVNLDRSGECQ
jgi:hypothetical protein